MSNFEDFDDFEMSGEYARFSGDYPITPYTLPEQVRANIPPRHIGNGVFSVYAKGGFDYVLANGSLARSPYEQFKSIGEMRPLLREQQRLDDEWLSIFLSTEITVNTEESEN